MRCSSAVCTSRSRPGLEERQQPAARMVAHPSLNCSSLAGTFHFSTTKDASVLLEGEGRPSSEHWYFSWWVHTPNKGSLSQKNLVTQRHRIPLPILCAWKWPAGAQGQSSREKETDRRRGSRPRSWHRSRHTEASRRTFPI